jgi:type I restriction enzyme S subunit
MEQDYLNLFILSMRQTIYELGTGSTFPSVSQDKIQSIRVPLPPLAEQRRIVAKVDQLFAQTRALEAKLRRAQEEIVVVNRAALHRLHTAADDEAFHTAWRTLADHFDLLYGDPRTVADLRQTLLDLAVRGKLVPQDPQDEPASELLERIRAEKERRAALSERTRTKPIAAVNMNEVPYAIPNTWRWVRVGEIADVRLGRQRSPKHHFGDHMRPYVRAANVTWQGLDLSDVKQMDFPPGVFESYLLQKGDILLNEASGSPSEVGKAAIWNDEIPNCCFQNTLIRVRLHDLWPEYIRLHFLNDARTGRFGRSSQGIGINHLGADRLANMPIALPPLAEQRRIVAKVEHLLRLCDELEARLRQGHEQGRRLAAAVLRGVEGDSHLAERTEHATYT